MVTRRRETARRGGFVMVDALIALAVLGFGVFFMVAFFRSEVRELRYAHDRLTAQLLAESEIERLRGIPHEEIKNGSALDLSLPSAERLANVRGRLAVETPAPGWKRATVRIEWDSPKGWPVSVELSGDFAEEGATP